ncbi:MAG: hypothetical protein R3C58_15765 [Parvularculaceae bacterium]
MIFHFSIAARNPKHTANVLAEIFGGEAHPFPVFEGSWMAHAGDDRNTMIEIYPHGNELVPADGMEDAKAIRNQRPSPSTATHAAVATPLTEAQVKAIAAREGWIAKTLNRGGMFRVIEFWVENTLMIEVLTAEMQKEYLAALTLDNWKKALAAAPAA